MQVSGYVPVQCSACRDQHLQLVAPGAVPHCRSCGAPAVVLPGAAYPAADVNVFDRIDAAVRSDLKSARMGRRLAAELAQAASTFQTPASTLLRVVDDLPTLSFLLPAVGVKPKADAERLLVARSLGMLLTIVRGRTRQLEPEG
jgi:hypothetical protein